MTLTRKFHLIRESHFKHFRLSPKPSKKLLEKYYEKEYYQNEKHHLHDFRKELKEQWWLDKVSEDYLFYLKKIGKTRGKILDVGCGNGIFLSYMKKKKWNVLGIEPSPSARENASKLGVPTQEDLTKIKKSSFDVIMLRFVLEHIRDPVEFLKKIKKFLLKDGILIVVVPNDFNPLQISATKLGIKQWWIRFPDHVNYFDFNSISYLLKKLHFSILHQTTDFPMELFLLMGQNYISNQKLGKKCHNQRMIFEKNIDPKLKRKLYDSFAQENIGRTCIVYAKK